MMNISVDERMSTQDADSSFEANHCTHNEDKKLFAVYEEFLEGHEDTLSEESESDASIDDDYYQLIQSKLKPKRTQNRRFSCFADVEKSFTQSDDHRRESLEASNAAIVYDDIDLPWDLNAFNETQIIEMLNQLICEVDQKKASFSSMIAKNMKLKFEKRIQDLNEHHTLFKNRVEQRLREAAEEKRIECEEKQEYDRLLADALTDNKNKSLQVKKLINDLKICQQFLKPKN